MFTSEADEAQMAVVEITHRRYECDVVAGMTPVTQVFAQCFSCADF